MRKILLGTTAVVGMALTAPAAFAQSASLIGAGNHGSAGSPAVATSGLSVRLGGFFDFSVGNVSDNYDSAQTSGTGNRVARNRNDMRVESEINLYVDGAAANGMRYGAVFELEMDALGSTGGTGNGNSTGVSYDELYGWVKGAWGELRFGNEDNVHGIMGVRPPAPLWTGSSAGWDEFVAHPAAGVGTDAPYLITEMQDGNDMTKIIYLSPQFMGFDFGVSYASNAYEGERTDAARSTTEYQRGKVGLTDHVNAAIRYRGTFGDVGVAASFSVLSAQAASASATGERLVAEKTNNLKIYSGGLTLSAYGFSVGGEYTWGNYTGRLSSATNRGIDESNHWLVGTTYTNGPWVIGGQYGVASQDNGTDANGNNFADRTQTYIGFGAAYTVAPGMTLFGSWNQVTDDNVLSKAPTTAQARTASGDYGSLVSFKGSNTRDIQVLMAGVRVAF